MATYSAKTVTTVLTVKFFFEEEVKDFPRGRNCELRFLLGIVKSKTAKDAFKSQAETSHK